MAQIARIIFKPHTESQSGTEGLSPADMADIADIFFVDDKLLLFGSTFESELSRYFKTISTFILE